MIENMETKEIKSRLSKGIVKFTYIKNDGTYRDAIGTLNPEIIEEHSGTPKGTSEKPDYIIAYYDIEADGWRSFRVESFVKFN